ncbi:MAG: ATP-grasp domain-containing protein [Proteobacteria bacterium]|nr:ATP-grasp domain-containing protein [Pseudomonadota bacterium]
MSTPSLLVANRGEIAIRILRAAAELGMRAVAVHSEDDARSLHTRMADECHPLAGTGAAAYLDAEQLVALASRLGCEAIHPGYGFLSEDAAFARRCAAEGIRFVGPPPAVLELFGDKVRARALAERCGVPVLPGTGGATTLDEARAFLASLGAGGQVMIKAVAGAGGRGMRAVRDPEELEPAYERCRSEARTAFGDGDVYVEQLIPRARHIEVQIVADGAGGICHLYERECSLQRRHQKIVEVAPSPGLSSTLRDRLTRAAVELARAADYQSLGTFEFLVDVAGDEEKAPFAFIEANPRLQVEHTVTEEVTGVDLVKTQLQLSEGRTLGELGLEQDAVPPPAGFALQLRINMETMDAEGTATPSAGTLRAFELPTGPGVRVDTFGYVGYETSPLFDSLLAKLIAHSPGPDFSDVLARAYRALCEFKIDGVATNVGFLQSLLVHPDVRANRVYTRFVEDHAAELAAGAVGDHQRRFFAERGQGGAGLAGARIDPVDPLAVLDHGKSPGEPSVAEPADADVPPGMTAVRAPLQGTIVSVDVEVGQEVAEGRPVLVMEAMKMEHVIEAEESGTVRQILVGRGDTVFEGHVMMWLEEGHVDAAQVEGGAVIDLDSVRPDLTEVLERHAVGLDPARPDAVARRRKTGQRTARENVADLCDPGTFQEYGPLVIAAQRRRRSVQELIEKTPADGMLAGVGRVNGDLFDERDEGITQCVVMAYDYTVLAGTQGAQNHRKKDRMFELAEKWRMPLVFFTEGGGGRPGDTDGLGVAGLDCFAFHYFGRLSGLVPLVGINSGRCFAGNAALLGCCDVVIATEGSNIGMGGPAMIEGGGLGTFRPEEVGPMDVQVPNGVVDIPVADEAEAVQVAKQYLSYFQGSLPDWECADQRLLRGVIPENRLRIYDVRRVVETLADTGSVLELRRHFGLGMVTAFIRVEGRPVGVIANNPRHLAGAIDSDGADKAARFMQLCDAFDIPILFLCDTPGIMVGPEVERTALVRHASRMFVTGASVTVPFFTIVLRKGYGLGAQAMAGGSFKAPFFTVSWPTGEFGGMGLEGAVKLGFRNELAAIEDAEERRALFEKMVDRMYEHGKAVNMASHFEIDEVIDPMDSRSWIVNTLRSVPTPPPRAGKKRPCVDTW